MGIINRRQLSGTGVSPAHVKKFLDLLDQALDEFVNIAIDGSADVGGGGTTANVGFQLKNVKGENLKLEAVLEFAVFDDEEMSIPAVNATLDTATKGTIIAGGASAALKVKTDENGKFTCTLTNAVDEQVFVGSSPSFGSPILDCRELDAITFSA